jgi:membrane-associated phospholipid phosphatase
VRYAFGKATNAVAAIAGIGRVIRDWLPFALFLSFYETLGSTIFSAPARERDAALLRIDRILFGETPSVAMQYWTTPALTELLGLCYFAHLVLPPLAAFFWYRRDLATFRQLLLSIFLCGAIGGICYVLVPAVGPALAYPDLYPIPLHGSRAMEAVAMMDTARAPHDVFPSLHVAISAIVLWFAWRYRGWMFWVFLPIVIGNWIATIYLRFHYAIDVIVAFPFALLMIVLAKALLALEARWRRVSDAVTG